MRIKRWFDMIDYPQLRRNSFRGRDRLRLCEFRPEWCIHSCSMVEHNRLRCRCWFRWVLLKCRRSWIQFRELLRQSFGQLLNHQREKMSQFGIGLQQCSQLELRKFDRFGMKLGQWWQFDKQLGQWLLFDRKRLELGRQLRIVHLLCSVHLLCIDRWCIGRQCIVRLFGQLTMWQQCTDLGRQRIFLALGSEQFGFQRANIEHAPKFSRRAHIQQQFLQFLQEYIKFEFRQHSNR